MIIKYIKKTEPTTNFSSYFLLSGSLNLEVKFEWNIPSIKLIIQQIM